MPTVLVTGATGGLGRNLALHLAAEGWHVVVGGRRGDAVDRVGEEVRAAGGSATPFVADLADLDAVRSAIDGLDVLDFDAIVTNAGITLGHDATSAQGHELTFAVNVLAHQMLLVRLVPRLVGGGRIVVVGSGVHDPDNRIARRAGVPSPVWGGVAASAALATAGEDPRLRYANSKLANLLQARALQDRIRTAGVDADVFGIDPGLMVDTDLARSYPRVLQVLTRTVGAALTPLVAGMRRSTTSAAHIARLLTDPALAGTGFAYFDGDRAGSPSPDARRDDLAAAFWRDANELIGLDEAAPFG